MADLEYLTADEVQKLQHIFTVVDTNKDGSLSKSEIAQLFQAIGVENSELAAASAVAWLDADRNGKVDFREFCQFFISEIKGAVTVEQIALEVFSATDIDRDGFLSFDELKNAAKKFGVQMSDEEVSAILRNVDVDCDGRVGRSEFVSYFVSEK